MQDVWSLPGPRQWVGQMLERLRVARVHVLHAPRDPAGLPDALERQLAEDGCYVLAFGPDGTRGFLAALAGRIPGRDGRSPAVLAGEVALQGSVSIVRVQGACDADLQAFARAVQHQPGDAAPRLLVIAGDAASALDGVSAEQVRGVVQRLDGAAYAAWLPRSREPLVGELVASVAIEVAAWDVPLLDRLTALPKAQAVRPDLHVPAWDGGQAASFAGVPLSWEHGAVDRWSGEHAEHPAWLAANKPAKLRKRVWRGQLAALLPWIELHRLGAVEAHRAGLEAVLGLQSEVELLDWGPLCIHLKEVDPPLARAAEPFRFARNELAHGRPITWPSIAGCLQRSSEFTAAKRHDAGARLQPDTGKSR